MKKGYKEYNPTAKSLATIDIANEIIDEMREDGYTLTLRQLYYQFIGKDLLPNTERSYKNLGNLLTKARVGGFVDWSAIEDRNRGCSHSYFEEDISTLFDSMGHFITFDMWKRQEYYVEAWVEKDALIGVLERPCSKYLVPYMACKGNVSTSEIRNAAHRFEMNSDKKCILLHLGDHDPSGMDMTRDNDARLALLSDKFTNIEVIRLALNMDQVDEYDLPPNPAKTTDSRSTGYIEKYGDSSWELDALSPKVIEAIIEDAIRPYIDFDIWNAAKAEEEDLRRPIGKLAGNVAEVLAFVDTLPEKEPDEYDY